MNQGELSSPEPDPRRLSLESLEQQLRTLPSPAVPEALPLRLIASIPPTKIVSSLASQVIRRWPWIAGVCAFCITVSAVVYTLQWHRNTKPVTELNANRNGTVSSPTGNDVPVSSKAVLEYERAVRFDPYNADAWFGLAKAQADVHRSSDAISSAQKAIDIARSRNRSDLVSTIQAWLRSYRAAQSGRSPR